jgi:hypothetical protein
MVVMNAVIDGWEIKESSDDKNAILFSVFIVVFVVGIYVVEIGRGVELLKKLVDTIKKSGR